jgi:hypothetical protein
MICNNLCSEAMPVGYANCKKQTRKAGIKSIGIMPCTEAGNVNLFDVADVITAVEAGIIVMLPVGIGSKPKPTAEKKKLESCQVDKPIGIWNHTLSYKSSYIDAENNTDYDFFNEVIRNANAYRFFWIDCNGQIFFNPDYVADSTTIHSGLDMVVDGGLDIVEDGTKEVQMYNLDLTFTSSYPIIKGHFIAGMDSALFDTEVAS